VRRLSIAALACALAVWAQAPAVISPDAYLNHIKYLASPELKGRATGSPELETAANYVASQFQSFGVKPVPGSTYEQAFTTTVGARLGANNRFEANTSSLALRNGFIPFSFSSSGTVTAPVVFVGYGITANEYHYDDYAGIDVKDKIVLVVRHEPQENDDKSVFLGKDLTQHSTFAIKAVNAKMHGARGVILVNDSYPHHTPQEDQLTPFGQATGPTDAGVLFVQVKESTAEAWFKADGRDLHEILDGIDKDLKPRSVELNKLTVSMTLDIQHDTKTVHNVAAYLPGKTSEYVIIGAHYDHLGLGDEHSLAPSQIGTIHPGADDNASGTAGVIELARWFAKQPPQQRGILFITFAGEELGLLGSNYYTGHPLLPLDKAVTMLNMDMIGRIRSSGKVYVNGTGTGSTLGKLVDSVKVPDPLKIDLSDATGYGGSDHMSFTVKQVPVLFFFSGLHGDYHKPSDTWDKIDAPAAARLLGYVAQIATRLANDPERPAFQRVAEPKAPSGSSSSSSGYGPNFGSIPDFDEPPKGVRFADVRDGTPAAKAGLKAGDILIEFDGKDIGNLYDFTYALQAHKPGDEVLVKVLRGSQTIEAKVLLTERR